MEQNVFLTKVISIVIAAVVAAVVLVPICDSIADNGGSSGGGSGGGGGDGSTGTVYTLDEYYGQTYPDWPYKSYQVYSSLVEGSSPFSITTSEIIGILDNLREMGVERDFRIMTAQIFCDNIAISGVIGVDEFTGGGFQYSFGYQVMDMADDSNSYRGNIYDTNTAQNQQQGKQGSFDFVCSSNGAYTLSATYYNYYGVGGMESKTNSGQAEFISFLSENENGYYTASMTMMGAPSCPIFDGQKYIIALSTYSETSADNLYLNAEMTPDTANSTFTITATDDGHTYTVSGELEQLDSGNGIIVDFDNVGVDPSDQEVYLWDVFISTQGTSEGGGDSGGDGGSSDTGVTGTLIKTIPIFVVLGIILGSVALFYQNRNDPGL